jgi:hypothetical protein
LAVQVLRKMLWLLLAAPAAALLIALAVANRHPVPLVLDPFKAVDGVLECDKREPSQLTCQPLPASARIASPVLAYDLPARPAIPMPAAPLYAYLFGTLLIGMLLGGMATWLGQSKWRKRLRERTHEAQRWHAEANSLKRQLKIVEASARGLPAPGNAESEKGRALAS